MFELFAIAGRLCSNQDERNWHQLLIFPATSNAICKKKKHTHTQFMS